MADFNPHKVCDVCDCLDDCIYDFENARWVCDECLTKENAEENASHEGNACNR